MTQDTLKQKAAEAAIDHIKYDGVIGVGTGSTVNFFIDALAKIKGRIDGAVASSVATAERLKAIGIPVLDLNSVSSIPLYVDGADEFNQHKYLIKGGGGALTREKIIAEVAEKFVCIVDNSKQVEVLGEFPLPVEVLPMARSYIGRRIVKMGGNPVYREGFVTDNGNIIIDIYDLDIVNPIEVEETINNWPGVVTNGLFAKRKADEILIATEQGIKTL